MIVLVTLVGTFMTFTGIILHFESAILFTSLLLLDADSIVWVTGFIYRPLFFSVTIN